MRNASAPLLRNSVIHRRAPAGGLSTYRGGQFLPTVLWESERQKARVAMPDLLDRLGDRLQLLRAVYEQNAALFTEGLTKVALVPLSTIEAQMKAAVREGYDQAFLLGKRAAGNLTAVTGPEQSAIKKVRIDEFRYLRGFLEAMRAQSGSMSYHLRADYYRAAARELFWLGFVLGNRQPGRLITWTMGRTEHCADCLRFANHGPYPVQEFIDDVLHAGYLPQSGHLDCIGYHCQCRLEESHAKSR